MRKQIKKLKYRNVNCRAKLNVFEQVMFRCYISETYGRKIHVHTVLTEVEGLLFECLRV